jgi:hypothetical protein
MDNTLDHERCWRLKAPAALDCMGVLEQGLMLLPTAATRMVLRQLDAFHRDSDDLPLGRINQPTDGTFGVRIRGHDLVSFLVT